MSVSDLVDGFFPSLQFPSPNNSRTQVNNSQEEEEEEDVKAYKNLLKRSETH